MANAYELLGINVGSSDQEIRTAYRQTALKYHPDKCKDDPRANERFAELVAAFEVLKNPERRKELDTKIKAHLERALRLKKQSAEKQFMVAKLEQREREAEEKLRLRKQDSMSDAIKQKIQEELVRFRSELMKEEALAESVPESPSPFAAPDLCNTIAVKISRKRKPSPDERDISDLFSRYGTVVDVVQSKKRRALVSFSDQTAMLSATNESERDFLDSMGISVSVYVSAVNTAGRDTSLADSAASDYSSAFPTGPPVSPLSGQFLPDDDIPFEEFESIVLGRMLRMAEKQQRQRKTQQAV